MRVCSRLPAVLFVLGLGIIEVNGKWMPKKFKEWSDRCKITVQQFKFVYKVWTKCRNKENFDNMMRNGGLDQFSDKIRDFVNCDSEAIVKKLKVNGGIKGRVMTKIMRKSLILFIEEIKKGIRRNIGYINRNSVVKYQFKEDAFQSEAHDQLGDI